MSRLPNVTNSMQARLGKASICFHAFRHAYTLSPYNVDACLFEPVQYFRILERTLKLSACPSVRRIIPLKVFTYSAL